MGLACLRQAPEGGGSGLASAVAVHDHLAERDPETLRRLHRWFYRDLVTPTVLSEKEKELFRELAATSPFDPRAHLLGDSNHG